MIEFTDVTDTEWQMDEINDLTERLGRELGAEVWVEEVEYET